MGRVYRAIEVSSRDRSAYTVGFVDTGADQSIMSRRLSDMIGAELRGYLEVVSASGHLISGRLAIVTITTLMDRKSAELEIGVTDELFEDEIDENGVEVIIGLDFLEYTNTRIEF